MINIELFRFIIVGVINTFIGLSVIYILLYFDYNNYISNQIGYIVGLSVSFILNKYYTFRNNNKVIEQIILFIIVFGIAYSINLIVLKYSLIYFNSYISQFFAMVSYTIVSYILNKFIIFR